MSQQVPNSKFLLWAPRFAAIAFGVAALAQANVQVLGRERLLDLGEKSNRFLVKRTDYARRGSVFSADGRPLAQDEDAAEFGVFFDRIPDSPAFFMALSDASGIPAAGFAGLKVSGTKKAFWPEPLTREQSNAVQDVKTAWRADGISVRATGRRIYPLGDAASCLLGYTKDSTPVAGLELGQEKVLQGLHGFTIGLTDLNGRFLPMRIDPRTRERKDGGNITLTIDSQLQLEASAAIRKAVEINKAESGSAIILDPKTGEILAMANWPSFDPARIGEPAFKGQRTSDFNPNYMGAYEPGSMFKILTLALGLDKGAVHPEDHVSCGGSLDVWPGHPVRCDAHHGVRAHGLVDTMLAIAKSCNVSAATWALKIGHEDFSKFLDASGLMSKQNLGLPAERGGEFNRNEYAKRLQLATFGFGQSMTCTPIGLASAFSALANGGVRMMPHLIKQEAGKEIRPREAGRLFSEATCSRVMGYMEAVIDSDVGTGKSLRIQGYRLAGKTGTAQKVNSLSSDGEGGYVSNFVGVVPADKPRALVLVMVDHPSAGKYYGSTVAGPVFQDIARAVIRRFAIPPSPVVKGSVTGPNVEVSASVQSNSKPEPEVDIRAKRVRRLGERVSP